LNLAGPPLDNPTGTPQISNLTFNNSILSVGNAGFYPTGGANLNCSWPGPSKADLLYQMIPQCWVGNSSFANNVLVAYTGTDGPLPAGNFEPTSWTGVDFVNYNNGLSGDYHLATGSLYKSAASDGTDPGANIDVVLQYTLNAIAGTQ
jgi:hypothetical protein